MKKDKQVCSHTTNNIERVGSYNPNAKVVNETNIIHVTINLNINFGGKRIGHLLYKICTKIPFFIMRLINFHLVGAGVSEATTSYSCMHTVFSSELIRMLQKLSSEFEDQNAISIKYVSQNLHIEQDGLTASQAIKMVEYESEHQKTPKYEVLLLE